MEQEHPIIEQEIRQQPLVIPNTQTRVGRIVLQEGEHQTYRQDIKAPTQGHSFVFVDDPFQTRYFLFTTEIYLPNFLVDVYSVYLRRGNRRVMINTDQRRVAEYIQEQNTNIQKLTTQINFKGIMKASKAYQRALTAQITQRMHQAATQRRNVARLKTISRIRQNALRVLEPAPTQKEITSYKNKFSNLYNLGDTTYQVQSLMEAVSRSSKFQSLVRLFQQIFQIFTSQLANPTQSGIYWNQALMVSVFQDQLALNIITQIAHTQTPRTPQKVRQVFFTNYLKYLAYLERHSVMDTQRSFASWLGVQLHKNYSALAPLLQIEETIFVQSADIQPTTTQITNYINRPEHQHFYRAVGRMYEYYLMNTQVVQQTPYLQFMKQKGLKNLVPLNIYPIQGKNPKYNYTSNVKLVNQQIVIQFNQPTSQGDAVLIMGQIQKLRQENQHISTLMQLFMSMVQTQLRQTPPGTDTHMILDTSIKIGSLRQILKLYDQQNDISTVYLHGQLSYDFGQQLPGVFQNNQFTRGHTISINNLARTQNFATNVGLLQQFLDAQKKDLYDNNYSGAALRMRLDSIRIYNRYRRYLMQYIQDSVNAVFPRVSRRFRQAFRLLNDLIHPGYRNTRFYQDNYYYGWADSDQQQTMVQNCMVKAYRLLCAMQQTMPERYEIDMLYQGKLLQVWKKHSWSYRTPGCKPLCYQGTKLSTHTTVLMPRHCYLQKKRPVFSNTQKQFSLCNPHRCNKSHSQRVLKNSFALDIQCLATIGCMQKCYLVCISGKLQNQTINMSWKWKRANDYTVTNPIQDFCDWLCQYVSSKGATMSPITIWTFNGAKYQNRYLLKSLIKRVKCIKSMGSPSASKGYVLFDGLVKILDAMLLVGGGSLKKNAQLYNPPKFRKLQLNIPLPTTYYDVQQNFTQVQQYCFMDCQATINLVWNFYKTLWSTILLITKDKPRMKYQDIFECFTASQIGINILRRQYSIGFQLDTQMNAQILKNEKQSYFGGMVQCFRIHVQQPMYSIDINSAYPYSMTKPLPFSRIGYQTKLNNSQEKQFIRKFVFQRPQIDNATDLHLFKVTAFIIGLGYCCFIPIRSKYGLTYPRSYYGQCYLWGHTLKYLFHTGGIAKIQTVTRYSQLDRKNVRCDFMQKYISDIYNIRSEKKRLMQEAQLHQDKPKQDQLNLICNMLKLWLNSTYGKFGQRNFNQTFVTDIQATEFDFVKQTQQQGYNVIQQSSKRTTGPGNFIKLASYITSLTRLHLCRKIDQLGVQNVVYCDTDSITAIGSPPNDLNSLKLGQFKFQKTYKQALFIAPKLGFLKYPGDQKKYSAIKSKGINFKQRSDSYQIIQSCKQRLLECIQKKELKFNTPMYLTTVPKCRRWIWDKQTKSGNVIESFPKKINYIQRKVYNYKTNRLEPPEYHHVKDLK